MALCRIEGTFNGFRTVKAATILLQIYLSFRSPCHTFSHFPYNILRDSTVMSALSCESRSATCFPLHGSGRIFKMR